VRAQKQATIDAAITEWFQATLAKAEELAERHGKKPCYFLDHFFMEVHIWFSNAPRYRPGMFGPARWPMKKIQVHIIY
jgi:hypothetical protein